LEEVEKKQKSIWLALWEMKGNWEALVWERRLGELRISSRISREFALYVAIR
jgi:hypothetical protein